jgi:hypothetical protein
MEGGIMRDYMHRILGGVLLILAFILLLLAPPRERFSVISLYAFLACLVSGYLLICGYFGTHPVASRLRREASPSGSARPGPLCHIPEQVFPAVQSGWRTNLAAGICSVMGLALIALGLILAHAFPLDHGLVGLPLWIAGALCIWCPLRQMAMYIRVDPQGMHARTYFRTTTLSWADVVALTKAKHSIFLPGPVLIPTIGQLDTVYSIYSLRGKIDFSARHPGSAQLVSLVSNATGLTWH